MRTKQMLGAAGAAALLLIGTGCAVSGGAPSTPTDAPPASSASASAPNSAEAAAPATSAPTPTQTPELVTDPLVALPPGPEPGTDAAVAWEALMSSDGEYAASAMYSAVIATFGPVEPYVSIREAEERHIAALIRQLERYGVTVPANPYLGNVPAPADLQTAAEAWATGEVHNVEMYDTLLTQTSDANLTKVLNNLRRASLDSHLPLFTAAAENGGTLTTEQMNALPG